MYYSMEYLRCLIVRTNSVCNQKESVFNSMVSNIVKKNMEFGKHLSSGFHTICALRNANYVRKFDFLS